MAYPSSPRVTPPWNFRDDTGVESHIVSTETASLVERKKGKMRRIVNDDAEEYYGGSADAPSEKKKVRKKWTEEVTRMLVNGCNKVSNHTLILSFICIFVSLCVVRFLSKLITLYFFPLFFL
jgi:hypothetical protein